LTQPEQHASVLGAPARSDRWSRPGRVRFAPAVWPGPAAPWPDQIEL